MVDSAHHHATYRTGGLVACALDAPEDIVGEVMTTLAAVLASEGVKVENRHLQAADRIIRSAWGGSRVYVPKSGATEVDQRQMRDRSIVLSFASGQEISEIATRFGLTQRRIRQILGEFGPTRVHIGSEMPCIEDFRKNHYDRPRSAIACGVELAPRLFPVASAAGHAPEEMP